MPRAAEEYAFQTRPAESRGGVDPLPSKGESRARRHKLARGSSPYRGGRFTVELQAVGAEIKDRREGHGMTIGHLANLAGVTRRTVYAVERGESRPLTVRKVLQALDRFEGKPTFHGSAKTRSDPGVVTYRLIGVAGVEVRLQGPVENIADLDASVARLLAAIARHTPTATTTARSPEP